MACDDRMVMEKINEFQRLVENMDREVAATGDSWNSMTGDTMRFVFRENLTELKSILEKYRQYLNRKAKPAVPYKALDKNPIY